MTVISRDKYIDKRKKTVFHINGKEAKMKRFRIGGQQALSRINQVLTSSWMEFFPKFWNFWI
jgi:hypothetical protein